VLLFLACALFRAALDLLFVRMHGGYARDVELLALGHEGRVLRGRPSGPTGGRASGRCSRV
jgi:hypothetical protein